MFKKALIAAAVAASGTAATAAVSSFSSAGSGMQLPGTGTVGPGAPNPLTLLVSGITGQVIDVNVTLNGLTHSFADDLNFGITGPTGAALYLMANAGGTGVYVSTNLTFDDQAASAIADGILPASGSYRVSRYLAVRTFAAPAPAFTFAGDLSIFNGLNPNGTWSLFGLDDTAGEKGSLRSFTVTVTTASNVPEPTTLALVGLALAGIGLQRKRAART